MIYSEAFEKYRNDELRVRKWINYFTRYIQETNKKVFLDCGCGVGRFTVPMSELFAKTYGVDKNDAMISIARKKSESVVWIQADVLGIPLENSSIDVLLASMLIEHIDLLDNFLHEISRLVKEDGVLLVRTMLPSDIEKTTWYKFSEKARLLELNRTRKYDSLIESFLKYGFELSINESIINEVECFGESNFIDRLKSRSYEVLHRLNEHEYNTLIDNAKKWEHSSDIEETMSSSLLIFRRKNIR